MHIRGIKALNLVLIFCILCSYQSFAQERTVTVEAYETQKKEADAAWEAYYAAQAEQSQTADQEKNGLKDGTYIGHGTGFGGDITVEVVITDGKIMSCEIKSAENETPEYLDAASALVDSVTKAKSAEVDTVSGATLSSNGILEAVRDCLAQAGKEA
ncbi:MAG: FMN-binding protein [Lachnospiraceae bacterium]